MPTDNFTRADGALGGSWTTWGNFPGTFNIVSNAASPTPAASQEHGAVYAGSTRARSQITIATGDGTPDCGPGIHMDSLGTAGTARGYAAACNDATNTILYRVDNSVFTNIGSVATGYTVGDTITLRRSGGNVIVSKNGTDILTVADSTYTAGSPGMYSWEHTLTLDNWTDGPPAQGLGLMGCGR